MDSEFFTVFKFWLDEFPFWRENFLFYFEEIIEKIFLISWILIHFNFIIYVLK